MDVDISKLPVTITKIGEYGEVDLDIGEFHAHIVEPKSTLLQRGIVCLTQSGSFWEKLVSANLGEQVCKGCTDDPRVVEIAKKCLTGKLSQKDVGTVYPPLK